jgi:hypothetical protein
MTMANARQYETKFKQKSGHRLSFRRRKKIQFENGTKIIDWTKGEWFAIIPDWMACRSQSEECWSYEVFLVANDHWKGRTGSEKYRGLEDLLRWMMLFGNDGGHGGFISWVFKLGSWYRLKMMFRNWTIEDQNLHICLVNYVQSF